MITDTILLLDTKAPGGSSGIRCGIITAGVGIAEAGKVTIRKMGAANPKSECERVEGGCKSGEVETFKAIHLPWKNEFFETEGLFVSRIEADGSGEPGWEVACNTLLGKLTDTFETESGKPEEEIGKNAESSSVLLARATYLRIATWRTSDGGIAAGLVLDTLLLLYIFGFAYSFFN